jgi:hypothetical protein
VVVVVLGRIAVKLIAAAWLAYVGFWREAAAAIGRQLRAAANAVVALLHLGGAVTAARAAVASAAAAAATVAVATAGAAGSTAHGAAGSASALAAAVAGEVLRLSTSVAARMAAAAAAARGAASGPALREGAKLLAAVVSAAAVVAAVAVAGVSGKRAGERAIAGARPCSGVGMQWSGHAVERACSQLSATRTHAAAH